MSSSESDLILQEALDAFRRTLSGLFRAEAKEYNHPLSHLETLGFVFEKKNPTMKDIAEHIGVTPPSATVLVDGMERKGLLARVKSPTDRREVKIKLTPKAIGLIKKLKGHKTQVMQHLFECLSDQEKKQLIAIIKKITVQ